MSSFAKNGGSPVSALLYLQQSISKSFEMFYVNKSYWMVDLAKSLFARPQFSPLK